MQTTKGRRETTYEKVKLPSKSLSLQLIEDIARYAAWLSKESKIPLRVLTPEVQILIDKQLKVYKTPAYKRKQHLASQARLNWYFKDLRASANREGGNAA